MDVCDVKVIEMIGAVRSPRGMRMNRQSQKHISQRYMIPNNAPIQMMSNRIGKMHDFLLVQG